MDAATTTAAMMDFIKEMKEEQKKVNQTMLTMITDLASKVDNLKPTPSKKRGARPRDRTWMQSTAIPCAAREGAGLPKRDYATGTKMRHKINKLRVRLFAPVPTKWNRALKYDNLLMEKNLLDYTKSWEKQANDALKGAVTLLYEKFGLNVMQSVSILQRQYNLSYCTG